MQNSNNIWKWSDGTQTPIPEMSLFSCLKAALHSMKRMRHYSDQTRFFEYKLDTARTSDKKTKAQADIKRCSDIKLFFAEKLEELSTQCNILATPLPSDFNDVKQLLKERFPDDKQSKEIKSKAETENSKQQQEVNAYF